MKFLEQYYQQSKANEFSISAYQGCEFAKTVAGDYNPIHNFDSKRFCVPGDLLFAIALQQYGVHQNMQFEFLDLVSSDTLLTYPTKESDHPGKLTVLCSREKPVLGIQYEGECMDNEPEIEQLLKSYVAFSGQNFPYILMPLMEKHNVMINPARPLVIYQSMAFSFSSLSYTNLNIELVNSSLEVNGKRGQALLEFCLNDGNKKIGEGTKKLVLSGLREYNHESSTLMIDNYLSIKECAQKSL